MAFERFDVFLWKSNDVRREWMKSFMCQYCGTPGFTFLSGPSHF